MTDVEPEECGISYEHSYRPGIPTCLECDADLSSWEDDRDDDYDDDSDWD